MESLEAGENGLLDAVEHAAATFPVAWERTRGELSGTLEGRHSTYSISIRSPHPSWLWVRVAIGERPDLERRAQIGLLCMAATRRFPTGGFHLPPGDDARVHSSAVIRLGRSQGSPDPAVVGNTLRQCVLDAELFAPMLRKLNGGSVIPAALAAGSDAFLAMWNEPDGIADHLRAPGPPPGSDRSLIDECETAARGAGWEVFRRTPTQIMVATGRQSGPRPVVTFVDAHDGKLIASAYPFGQDENVPSGRRPAVSELLNRIVDRNAPFGLALDLENGAVSALSFLDFSGASALPSYPLLCDLIYQATEGAERFGGSVMRVAHDDVPPEWALSEVGSAQHGAPRLDAAEHALSRAAQAVAEALPAIWEHREPGRIVGLFKGRHGMYAVDMLTTGGRLFSVMVVSINSSEPDYQPEIEMLCMELNRTLPTGDLHLSAKLNRAVVSEVRLRLGPHDPVPEPALLENQVKQAIVNAELATSMIPDIKAGLTAPLAIERGIERFMAHRGTPADISDLLRFVPGAPATTEELSRACEAACQASGAHVLRRTPTLIIVTRPHPFTSDTIATFVDTDRGDVYASTYLLDPENWVPPRRRPHVAHLLNAILDLGVPYGLALDLETGNVRSRGSLTLSGLTTMPAASLLDNVITMSAIGSTAYIDAIMLTAQSDIDPDAALRDSEAARIAQRRAS